MDEMTEEIDIPYDARVYYSFLKKYKKYVFSILFFSFIYQIISIVNSFVLKILVDNATGLSNGSVGKTAFLNLIASIVVFYTILIALKILSNWLKNHFLNRLTTGMLIDLRNYFFDKIISLSYHFHTTRKTGTLISRIGRGTNAVDNLNDIIVFGTLPIIFQIIVVMGSLLYFDALSALIVIVSVCIFIPVSVFFQLKFMKPAQSKANNADDLEKAFVADSFMNIESIKHFARENFVINIFKALRNRTAKAYLKSWDYYRWLSSIQIFITDFTRVLLIGVSMSEVLSGRISVGTGVFIITVYGSLLNPLNSFVNSIRRFYNSIVDFDSLSRYSKEVNEVFDPKNPDKLEIEKGEISFEAIDFSYDNKVVFKDFSLKIAAGKKVALVGHSGSGKTTLVKLLFRLYDVNKGSVKIDKTDIKNVKKNDLRNNISIVPQECALFDDTIYNNILFSNPGASRNDVFRAIKAANLWDFVKSLPLQENTVVGERGVRLSGGEKQRVSIARAILADRKILVLDEATSSLDSKTEFEIQRSLQRLMHSKTSIIIAHRLSTIMKADMIVVLDNGRIVQTGTHSDLIKNEGKYKELWDLQRGGYLLE